MAKMASCLRPKKYAQIVEYNKWKRYKIAQAIREVCDE